MIKTTDDIELFLIGETVLAYLESFMATAFEEAFPITEKFSIYIYYEQASMDDALFDIISSEDKNEIYIYIKKHHKLKTTDIFELMGKLVPLVIGNSYTLKDYKEFFYNLFENDEIHERVSLITHHKGFLINILSECPKYFLRDWKKKEHKNYSSIRNNSPIKVNPKKASQQTPEQNAITPNFNFTTHREIESRTVINTSLWGKAKWRAFGVVVTKEIPLGIILAFEDEQATKKIFEGWIEEYGKKDLGDHISITIIKGIRKDKPFWYKVLISKKLDNDEFQEGVYFSLSSRFITMEAESTINLDKIVELYDYYRQYLLIPACINQNNQMIPFPEFGIWKTELKVIDSWEIGLNDIERVAITKEDQPIIPNGVKDAPILKVLKEKPF